jgi:hypothetical protein
VFVDGREMEVHTSQKATERLLVMFENVGVVGYTDRELESGMRLRRREKIVIPALATMRAALLAFGATASVPDPDTAVALTSPGR